MDDAEARRRARASWETRIFKDDPEGEAEDGKAAGVLVSPAEFDRLSERARFVGAVEEGLADERAGRVSAHADVEARMKARFRTKPAR